MRPILEYSSVIWNPYLINDIQEIEKVQRRFTKRILFHSDLEYEDRLRFINLEELELRRIYFDAILTFKILKKGLLDPLEFFVTPPPSITRSNLRDLLYLYLTLNTIIGNLVFRLDVLKYGIFYLRSLNLPNLFHLLRRA